MKILCIHGIGHQEARANWRNDWVATIHTRLAEWSPGVPADVRHFAYDQQFADADASSGVYLSALAHLLKSWVVHAGERDLFGIFDRVRWTVGMVAQWSALDDLRADLRAAFAAEIAAYQPDVIVAHSLGTLITYDTLRNADSAGVAGFGGSLVTCGSQIAHPALRDLWGGRIEAPLGLTRWWNLHNENDVVFTAPITLPSGAGAETFTQIETPFVDAPFNHDADCYLDHGQTREALWRPLAVGAGHARSVAVANAENAAVAAPAIAPPPRPALRALLVGVADYENPAYHLDGPVNDVFLVSQTLQELGVEADAIRVVLNDRATAAGIRERLHWLLDDTRDGDTLFFYFSGHGAQVPAYGRDAEADHIDECLVPYDFNWQTGNAIFDDEFAGLYGQLPYGCKFVAMLDCCHAGGMERGVRAAAQAPGVRSIAPPDDIRHRALYWEPKKQMWLPRKTLERKGQARREEMAHAEAARAAHAAAARAAHTEATSAPSTTKIDARLGSDGTLRRFGRAQGLRGDDTSTFYARRTDYQHKGPYMPILLEACAEKESAYEYQHGAVSYGAFTWALCQALKFGRAKRGATFETVIQQAGRRIKPVAAGPQHPQLVCPDVRRGESIL